MTNTDWTATYGGKRYLVDISVSATQIKKIGTTATDKVEAGMAATARYKEKVMKYGPPGSGSLCEEVR
jgi:hypothetical protein